MIKLTPLFSWPVGKAFRHRGQLIDEAASGAPSVALQRTLEADDGVELLGAFAHPELPDRGWVLRVTMPISKKIRVLYLSADDKARVYRLYEIEGPVPWEGWLGQASDSGHPSLRSGDNPAAYERERHDS